MKELIFVYEGLEAIGPCGGGWCYAYYKACELWEGGTYVPVECIETIKREDTSFDEDVSITITGEIGDIEYEDVTMLEAATHYIVNCKLARLKKQKEAEAKEEEEKTEK